MRIFPLLFLVACNVTSAPATGLLPAQNGQPAMTAVDDVDLGVANVVLVKDSAMEPSQVTISLGQTVRFVFVDAGHNAATASSSGDMDPSFAADARFCSSAGCYPLNAHGDSPQGSHWDFTPPYADTWLVLCGNHGGGAFTAGPESVWISVR